LNKVVFPNPDGPTIAFVVPGSISKLKSYRITLSFILNDSEHGEGI